MTSAAGLFCQPPSYAYEHADGCCDVVPEALELINMGGVVKED